jgi:hypothetical protein
MVHPIFSVLIRRPELLVDHVAGYAALARDEASSAGHGVARRAIAWAAAVLGAVLFLGLAGVAVMLGVLLDRFHVALVLVPAVALALAIAGFVQARKPLPDKVFAELKAQLDADAQALRAIGTRS